MKLMDRSDDWIGQLTFCGKGARRKEETVSLTWCMVRQVRCLEEIVLVSSMWSLQCDSVTNERKANLAEFMNPKLRSVCVHTIKVIFVDEVSLSGRRVHKRLRIQ